MMIYRGGDGVWISNGTDSIFVSDAKLRANDKLSVEHDYIPRNLIVVYEQVEPLKAGKGYTETQIDAAKREKTVVLGLGSGHSYQWLNGGWSTGRVDIPMDELPVGNYEVLWAGEE